MVTTPETSCTDVNSGIILMHCRFVMKNPNQKHPWCKKSCGQELEKGLDEKEVKSKMGGQGLCSATTDQNKILIITSQAAKHYVLNLVMFCGLTCDY